MENESPTTGETTPVIEVPSSVRGSNFGCRNCLWASVECDHGSMYKPDNGECDNYTYYD